MGNFDFNRSNKGKLVIFTSALILAGFPTVVSAEETGSQASTSLALEHDEFSFTDVEGADNWLAFIQQTDMNAFDPIEFTDQTNTLYINFLNDHSSMVDLEIFIHSLEEQLRIEDSESLRSILVSLMEHAEVELETDNTDDVSQDDPKRINEMLYHSFLVYIEANNELLSDDLGEATYTIEELASFQSLFDDASKEEAVVTDEPDVIAESSETETVMESEDVQTDIVAGNEEPVETVTEPAETTLDLGTSEADLTAEDPDMTDTAITETVEITETEKTDAPEASVEVTEPAVESETVEEEAVINTEIAASRYFVSTSSTDAYKQQLIYDATNGGASSRWHAAIEGHALYPSEPIFIDQLVFLSKRMLAIGIEEHEANNYSSAAIYYNRISNGPSYLFDADTLNTANTNLAWAVSNTAIISKEVLIDEATIGTASSRWYAAIDGYAYFPTEKIFIDQLQYLSGRMLTFGMQEHETGNYAGALAYYNRITKGPTELFSTTLVQNTKIYQTQAANKQRLVTKETLITEATSGGASSRWHAALEGYSYYPMEQVFRDQLRLLSERMLDFGMQEHEAGNYAGALAYYSRIMEGPTELFGTTVVQNTKIYQTQAANNQRLMTKETLISEATSGGASSRWSAATDGYKYYPNEQIFKDQLRYLSDRMLTFGMDQHLKGDYAGALGYYSRITEGPTELFSAALVQNTKIYQTQATKKQRLMTKATLIAEATSGGASSRWSAAIYGYTYYPSEQLFKDQLRLMADRMLDLGTQEHRLGNYAAALVYYNRITEGPTELFDASLMNEVVIYKTQAQNKQKFLSIHSLEYKAQNGDLMSRWQASKAGYEMYGNQTFIELLRNTSNELFDAAVKLHEAGRFAEADALYQKLLSLDKTFDTIVVKATANKYFAENNLYIVNSVYYNSNYQMTLSQMLDSQMRNNPQTDMYGNGWQTAKREDVSYYVNPTNFIEDFDNNFSAAHQIKIATSSLNVRSLPSTNGTILGSVKLNEIYEVISYQDGWYKIAYNGTEGWVSGGYVEPINNPKEFDLEILTAVVNASVLNVRQNAGTEFAIVGQVALGNELTIIGTQDAWLNIKYNGITGWVHGDFVNLESAINKDALQFLVLSGNSGISALDLNKELAGKGILDNKGASFILASQKYNVNEIYLLSHALLETGNGGSRLATGVLVSVVDGIAVTPKVVYNMYGIGAFDASPLRTGSEYAYKQGWDTPEKAIIEGAKWISDKYINHTTYRQDTLYKMRWNPASPGSHQYATDIGWAFKQTKSLNYLVELSQKYNFVLRFDLPTFK